MVKRKTILSFLLVINIAFIKAQVNRNIEGYFISYISKKELKKPNIDVMRGYIFIPSQKREKLLQLTEKEIHDLEQNRDSVFFISTNLITGLNSLFHSNYQALTYDKELFPTLDNFTYRKGEKLYKSTFVKVNSIEKKVTEKQLIPYIPFPKYMPKKDSISVFLIRELSQ